MRRGSAGDLRGRTASPAPAPDRCRRRVTYRTARCVWAAAALVAPASVPRGRRPHRSLGGITRVGGDRMVAPEPAHHLRQNGAAHRLAVTVHAPGIVDVVALLRERLHQPDVL